MLNKYAVKHKQKLFNFSHLENYALLNKSILYNKRLSLKLRSFFFTQNLQYNVTTLRNRCIVNNRSRAVYSKLNISRIPMKTNVLGGHINGFFRSSW